MHFAILQGRLTNVYNLNLYTKYYIVYIWYVHPHHNYSSRHEEKYPPINKLLPSISTRLPVDSVTGALGIRYLHLHYHVYDGVLTVVSIVCSVDSFCGDPRCQRTRLQLCYLQAFQLTP